MLDFDDFNQWSRLSDVGDFTIDPFMRSLAQRIYISEDIHKDLSSRTATISSLGPYSCSGGTWYILTEAIKEYGTSMDGHKKQVVSGLFLNTPRKVSATRVFKTENIVICEPSILQSVLGTSWHCLPKGVSREAYNIVGMSMTYMKSGREGNVRLEWLKEKQQIIFHCHLFTRQRIDAVVDERQRIEVHVREVDNDEEYFYGEMDENVDNAEKESSEYMDSEDNVAHEVQVAAVGLMNDNADEDAASCVAFSEREDSCDVSVLPLPQIGYF